jgi:hypothetical protein
MLPQQGRFPALGPACNGWSSRDSTTWTRHDSGVRHRPDPLRMAPIEIRPSEEDQREGDGTTIGPQNAPVDSR